MFTTFTAIAMLSWLSFATVRFVRSGAFVAGRK